MPRRGLFALVIIRTPGKGQTMGNGDRYIDAGGICTRYREAGRGGVPLVMLHGLSGSLEDWGGAVTTLSRHRRVVAFDLLGCGRTAKPREASYAPDEMRDHALAVLDALGLERVDLNGWSMGGRIALELAHAEPGRIDRLVLTAPAGIGPDSIVSLRGSPLPVLREVTTRPAIAGFRILRNALRQDRGAETLRLVGRRVGMAADRRARAAFAAQLRSFMGAKGFLAEPRHALLARLGDIVTPTCAIWGRRDMFVPAAHATILKKRMPNCEIVLLDGCGHMPQLEEPEAYIAAIDRFLLDGRPSRP